jgi:1,2-dihydroxy-3-keto-5-methylthiopentene dioxygenase
MMAKLLNQNGDFLRELEEIQPVLAPLDVELKHWPVNDSADALLAKATLDEQEKQAVLEAHAPYFEILKRDAGYQTQDLIVLHSGIPNLDALLQKFAAIHTHDDDEVRYIVEGEGCFGFVMPDESQILLTVEAGEYINVPAGTEHWFVLTGSKRIKAVRYFTTTEGWSPKYTDRPVRVSQ